MDARALSALLLAIVSLALAVAMLLRPARSRLFTQFAGMNVVLGAWAIGRFLCGVGDSPLALRLTVAMEALLPAVFLGFFVEFLGETGAKSRRTLRFSWVAGTVLLVAALTGLLEMKPASWELSPLRTFVALYGFALASVVASLLYARMKQSLSRTDRARLQYLFVGTALTIALLALDVVTRNIAFPPAGTVALTVYVFFLSQTLLRHRLLDLNELLGKFVVLSLLALLLAAIYGALVSWVVGVSGEGSWAGLFLFNTLVASFVVLILFEPLKAKVEGAVVSLLFRERWELLRTLGQLRQRIASLIGITELGRVLLDTLYETRRVTHASLYLLSDDGLGFRRVDHRGPPPTPYLDAATARGIVNAAAAGQRAVLIENVERRLFELRSLQPATHEEPSRPHPEGAAGDEATRLSEIGAALAAMRAGVCIPLLGGDRVLGFLNLLDDRVAEAFSSDEIAVMLQVADQAAITVENSRLYERMKERDRLAALGEMAAGLAHEIRNPLGAIKGAVQILDPRAVPEDEGELVGVILDEVDRLDSVVTQFLEYARPLRSAFAPADVNDVIGRTVKLLAGYGLPDTIEVRQDLEDNLPPVNCDADQLKQVFINLALNAGQAMPDGGTLTITTRRPRTGEWRLHDDGPRYAGDQVEIRFSDTGAGISEEVRQHIFIPFYTTKEKGSGLGLAICQRIVKNHGGTIEVRSRPGDGTQFVLRLPTNANKPYFDQTLTPLPANRIPLDPDVDRTPLPGSVQTIIG